MKGCDKYYGYCDVIFYGIVNPIRRKSMFTTKTKVLQNGRSSLQYAIIPWDSDYLHNTTLEIEHISTTSLTALERLINRLQNTLNLKKSDLLVIKIPPKEYPMIHLLDQVGFHFVEQTITLDIDLSSWTPQDYIFPNASQYKIVPADISDKQSIQDIAKATFVADRFHLDTRISKSRADYRFEMWIENSFHSEDTVFKFVDNKGVIVGFFIIREHPEYAELRLAGLHTAHVGRGLGKILYHHMYHLLKEKKYSKVKAIISLNNLPVMNIYMYLGHGKFVNPLFVLHKVI